LGKGKKKGMFLKKRRFFLARRPLRCKRFKYGVFGLSYSVGSTCFWENGKGYVQLGKRNFPEKEYNFIYCYSFCAVLTVRGKTSVICCANCVAGDGWPFL